jgi:hypothetical protein
LLGRSAEASRALLGRSAEASRAGGAANCATGTTAQTA